ncbi:MAG: carboxylesterase family protein [Deltaproteobacteria bacterium]|jgi:para-nitrobenzyl esterase|nr:carboxylesterase family protein [Deltaproteobacteria bacterium]
MILACLAHLGRAAIFFMAICAFFLSLSQHVEADTKTVVTKYGPIIGFNQEDISIFRGIPYAAPPVGELRFAPPQDPGAFTEPFEAKDYGKICYQVPDGNALLGSIKGTPQSEDCLTLNIWAPKGAKPGDKLPVFFYIHGGGFGIGTGSGVLINGSNLAKRDIIVVTINYRLGGLGFLATDQTLKLYGTTGNWGILDQIKALEWVRDNIEAFGGDPAKVTIGGESAGSMSVSSLLVSPLIKDKGLFRGAIMQSGTFGAYYNWPNNLSFGDLTLALNQGALIMAILRAKDDAEGLMILRAADPEFISNVTQFNFDFSKFVPFSLTPVFDGHTLPEDPFSVVLKGDYNKVNVLIGYNGNEGSLFIPNGSDLESSKNLLALTAGQNVTNKYWDRFPPDGQNTELDRCRDLTGFVMILAGAKRFADLHSRHSQVYFYNYSYATLLFKAGNYGAFHSSELPLIFGHPELMGYQTEYEYRLGEDMQTRWVNFIKNGDPNVGDEAPTKVHWPVYDPENMQIMDFGDEVISIGLPRAEDLDFMAELLYGPIQGEK